MILLSRGVDKRTFIRVCIIHCVAGLSLPRVEACAVDTAYRSHGPCGYGIPVPSRGYQSPGGLLVVVYHFQAAWPGPAIPLKGIRHTVAMGRAVMVYHAPHGDTRALAGLLVTVYHFQAAWPGPARPGPFPYAASVTVAVFRSVAVFPNHINMAASYDVMVHDSCCRHVFFGFI